jgi:hypothetical protein
MLGPEDSTLTPTRDLPAIRAAMHWRRSGLILLWAIVIAGATGLLGVHSRDVSSSGQGYRATLSYPAIARAGWDVPWHLVVTAPGGFGDSDVTIAVSRSFFDIYETQGFHPEPDAETSDADYVYLRFSPPPSDTLVIDYDAYIQPTAQRGRRASLVLITDGQQRLRLSWRTFLLP